MEIQSSQPSKISGCVTAGISGGPPAVSVVAASCAPSRAQAILSKSATNRPSLRYVLGDGNEAPVMGAIHVKFVEMRVALLRNAF